MSGSIKIGKTVSNIHILSYNSHVHLFAKFYGKITWVYGLCKNYENFLAWKILLSELSRESFV